MKSGACLAFAAPAPNRPPKKPRLGGLGASVRPSLDAPSNSGVTARFGVWHDGRPMRRDPALSFTPSQRLRPWPETWSDAGVVSVLEPMVGDARRERIQRVLAARCSSVTVLLDRPHDPHNGAAVMRSCDAFGVQTVHVIPTEEEFLASNLVAKGAERWLDVVSHPSPQAALRALQQAQFTVVATHPRGELEPEDLASLPRVALVLGNEHTGICDALEQSAGRSVRIPMVGFVESLNMSVSAAILVRAATRGRAGDLSAAELQRLYARGLYHSLQRSDDILRSLAPR